MDPDTVQVMVSVVAVDEVTLRLLTGPGTAVVGTTIVGVAVPGGRGGRHSCGGDNPCGGSCTGGGRHSCGGDNPWGGGGGGGGGTAVVGTTIVGVAVPGELMTKQTKGILVQSTLKEGATTNQTKQNSNNMWQSCSYSIS